MKKVRELKLRSRDIHPYNLITPMTFTAIDLFCGSGGLSLGLASAGFQVVGAMDNWNVAVQTYRSNFPHPVVCDSVVNVSGHDLRRRFNCAEVALVTGGPPCQGFSIQRIGSDQDERNVLILEFARLVVELGPRMFLMENVPGLLGKRGKEVAARFAHKLRGAGYEVRSRLINAADYGVPQIRKRVFFCGWRKDCDLGFVFPEPTHTAGRWRTVSDALGGLPSPPADYQPLLTDALHRRTKLSLLNLERLRHIPPGGGFEDLPVELRVNCHKNGASAIGHRYVYGRLAPNRPAATITARFDSFTRGKFAHPSEDRNITLREGARLQTFPDDFRFVGTQEEIAAQIGNAVPPRLAAILANSIHAYLAGGEGQHEKCVTRAQFDLF